MSAYGRVQAKRDGIVATPFVVHYNDVELWNTYVVRRFCLSGMCALCLCDILATGSCLKRLRFKGGGVDMDIKTK